MDDDERPTIEPFARLPSGLIALYLADRQTFLAMIKMTTDAMEGKRAESGELEEEQQLGNAEAPCDLGLLVRLVVASKSVIASDVAARRAVVSLFAALVKSVIRDRAKSKDTLSTSSTTPTEAAAPATSPDQTHREESAKVALSWRDIVQIARCVVYVLQSEGPPAENVSSPLNSPPEKPSTNEMPSATPLSEALYTSLSELDMVCFCDKALRQYFALLQENDATKTRAALEENDLVVLLKCTKQVIAVSRRETLTEWNSEDEKEAWERLFACILKVSLLVFFSPSLLLPEKKTNGGQTQVQALISGKSAPMVANERINEREEIKMERVMEILLPEGTNKRFAYLDKTFVDNPVFNAYCHLVVALARKDVQLIYPQIVEGGTFFPSCPSITLF